MILKVNEIFYSIQGESLNAGLPSLFIRLTGCNLNCSYCDTLYARTGGTDITIDSIMDIIKGHSSADHITITGGEPLLQENTISLLKKIIDNGNKTQIETNGSLSLKDIPKKARKIVDIKTPSSREQDSFDFHNLEFVSEDDEIKFVISDKIDYDFSRDFIKNHLSGTKALINFSPVYNKMPYSELADLILSDSLPVRLNLQLHKIIWEGEERGIPLLSPLLDSSGYKKIFNTRG